MSGKGKFKDRIKSLFKGCNHKHKGKCKHKQPDDAGLCPASTSGGTDADLPTAVDLPAAAQPCLCTSTCTHPRSILRSGRSRSRDRRRHVGIPCLGELKIIEPVSPLQHTASSKSTDSWVTEGDSLTQSQDSEHTRSGSRARSSSSIGSRPPRSSSSTGSRPRSSSSGSRSGSKRGDWYSLGAAGLDGSSKIDSDPSLPNSAELAYIDYLEVSGGSVKSPGKFRESETEVGILGINASQEETCPDVLTNPSDNSGIDNEHDLNRLDSDYTTLGVLSLQPSGQDVVIGQYIENEEIVKHASDIQSIGDNEIINRVEGTLIENGDKMLEQESGIQSSYEIMEDVDDAMVDDKENKLEVTSDVHSNDYNEQMVHVGDSRADRRDLNHLSDGQVCGDNEIMNHTGDTMPHEKTIEHVNGRMVINHVDTSTDDKDRIFEEVSDVDTHDDDDILLENRHDVQSNDDIEITNHLSDIITAHEEDIVTHKIAVQSNDDNATVDHVTDTVVDDNANILEHMTNSKMPNCINLSDHIDNTIVDDNDHKLEHTLAIQSNDDNEITENVDDEENKELALSCDIGSNDDNVTMDNVDDGEKKILELSKNDKMILNHDADTRVDDDDIFVENTSGGQFDYDNEILDHVADTAVDDNVNIVDQTSDIQSTSDIKVSDHVENRIFNEKENILERTCDIQSNDDNEIIIQADESVDDKDAMLEHQSHIQSYCDSEIIDHKDYTMTFDKDKALEQATDIQANDDNEIINHVSDTLIDDYDKTLEHSSYIHANYDNEITDRIDDARVEDKDSVLGHDSGIQSNVDNEIMSHIDGTMADDTDNFPEKTNDIKSNVDYGMMNCDDDTMVDDKDNLPQHKNHIESNVVNEMVNCVDDAMVYDKDGILVHACYIYNKVINNVDDIKAHGKQEIRESISNSQLHDNGDMIDHDDRVQEQASHTQSNGANGVMSQVGDIKTEYSDILVKQSDDIDDIQANDDNMMINHVDNTSFDDMSKMLEHASAIQSNYDNEIMNHVDNTVTDDQDKVLEPESVIRKNDDDDIMDGDGDTVIHDTNKVSEHGNDIPLIDGFKIINPVDDTMVDDHDEIVELTNDIQSNDDIAITIVEDKDVLLEQVIVNQPTDADDVSDHAAATMANVKDNIVKRATGIQLNVDNEISDHIDNIAEQASDIQPNDDNGMLDIVGDTMGHGDDNIMELVRDIQANFENDQIDHIDDIMADDTNQDKLMEQMIGIQSNDEVFNHVDNTITNDKQPIMEPESHIPTNDGIEIKNHVDEILSPGELDIMEQVNEIQQCDENEILNHGDDTMKNGITTEHTHYLQIDEDNIPNENEHDVDDKDFSTGVSYKAYEHILNSIHNDSSFADEHGVSKSQDNTHGFEKENGIHRTVAAAKLTNFGDSSIDTTEPVEVLRADCGDDDSEHDTDALLNGVVEYFLRNHRNDDSCDDSLSEDMASKHSTHKTKSVPHEDVPCQQSDISSVGDQLLEQGCQDAWRGFNDKQPKDAPATDETPGPKHNDEHVLAKTQGIHYTADGLVLGQNDEVHFDEQPIGQANDASQTAHGHDQPTHKCNIDDDGLYGGDNQTRTDNDVQDLPCQSEDDLYPDDGQVRCDTEDSVHMYGSHLVYGADGASYPTGGQMLYGIDGDPYCNHGQNIYAYPNSSQLVYGPDGAVYPSNSPMVYGVDGSSYPNENQMMYWDYGNSYPDNNDMVYWVNGCQSQLVYGMDGAVYPQNSQMIYGAPYQNENQVTCQDGDTSCPNGHQTICEDNDATNEAQTTWETDGVQIQDNEVSCSNIQHETAQDDDMLKRIDNQTEDRRDSTHDGLTQAQIAELPHEDTRNEKCAFYLANLHMQSVVDDVASFSDEPLLEKLNTDASQTDDHISNQLDDSPFSAKQESYDGLNNVPRLGMSPTLDHSECMCDQSVCAGENSEGGITNQIVSCPMAALPDGESREHPRKNEEDNAAADISDTTEVVHLPLRCQIDDFPLDGVELTIDKSDENLLSQDHLDGALQQSGLKQDTYNSDSSIQDDKIQNEVITLPIEEDLQLGTSCGTAPVEGDRILCHVEGKFYDVNEAVSTLTYLQDKEMANDIDAVICPLDTTCVYQLDNAKVIDDQVDNEDDRHSTNIVSSAHAHDISNGEDHTVSYENNIKDGIDDAVSRDNKITNDRDDMVSHDITIQKVSDTPDAEDCMILCHVEGTFHPANDQMASTEYELQSGHNDAMPNVIDGQSSHDDAEMINKTSDFSEDEDKMNHIYSTQWSDNDIIITMTSVRPSEDEVQAPSYSEGEFSHPSDHIRNILQESESSEKVEMLSQTDGPLSCDTEKINKARDGSSPDANQSEENCLQQRGFESLSQAEEHVMGMSEDTSSLDEYPLANDVDGMAVEGGHQNKVDNVIDMLHGRRCVSPDYTDETVDRQMVDEVHGDVDNAPSSSREHTLSEVADVLSLNDDDMQNQRSMEMGCGHSELDIKDVSKQESIQKERSEINTGGTDSQDDSISQDSADCRLGVHHGLVDVFEMERQATAEERDINKAIFKLRKKTKRIDSLKRRIEQLTRESSEITRLYTRAQFEEKSLLNEAKDAKKSMTAVCALIGSDVETNSKVHKLETLCYRRYVNITSEEDAQNVLTSIRNRQKALSDLELMVYRKQLILNHSLPGQIDVEKINTCIKKPRSRAIKRKLTVTEDSKAKSSDGRSVTLEIVSPVTAETSTTPDTVKSVEPRWKTADASTLKTSLPASLSSLVESPWPIYFGPTELAATGTTVESNVSTDFVSTDFASLIEELPDSTESTPTLPLTISSDEPDATSTL